MSELSKISVVTYKKIAYRDRVPLRHTHNKSRPMNNEEENWLPLYHLVNKIRLIQDHC